MRRLTELAADYDRPVATVTIGVTGALGTAPGLPSASDMARNLARTYGITPEQAAGVPFTGTAKEVAARLADYEHAGAGHLVIGLTGEGWRDQCEVLAEATRKTG